MDILFIPVLNLTLRVRAEITNRINLMGLYILIPTILIYEVERLYAKKLFSNMYLKDNK